MFDSSSSSANNHQSFAKAIFFCFSLYPALIPSTTPRFRCQHDANMLSTITTIALMATAAFALPGGSTYGSSKPTCMEVGTKVKSWTVENFDYHATYMSLAPGQFTHVKGYVNFDLVNPALPYKAKCSALCESQPEPFSDKKATFKCKVDKKYGTDAASFKFNLATGKLEIKQSWACAKEGGRFEADGFVTVKNPQCTDLTTTNNLWRKGSLYSTREVACPKIKVKAPVKNLSAVL
ncbi:hypothetical protein NLU13_2237 [Sarocladium strictum]|uniref:AA1-like domain-containing protein n=1 Tax=Sarocladium strictum TaxID=5046 RepID=A0AA39GV84_SARSR|nr:hypothetical protein NLU13_2237 [Sarocladium strictum]